MSTAKQQIERIGLDPDLALIQDRWPKLPEHIRAAILRIAHEHTHQDQDGRQTP